jgi:cytochrome b pre-mRNA-processing protein 3
MLNLRSRKVTVKQAATRLHAALAAQARAPVFYAKLGVPDTVDGRFDLVVLHAFLVLEGTGKASLKDLSQALSNMLFVGFDEGLRDLGAGDMGMGRRMKQLGDAFYGRVLAYSACADAQTMRDALTRNLYRGADAGGHAAAVAQYVLAARERVAASDLAAGEVDFGPLP